MIAWALLCGCYGIALGLYILATRLNVLSIDRNAPSYVVFWAALGSGCMIGGVFAIEAGAVGYAYLAHLAAASAYMLYERRPGAAWHPPANACTDPVSLDGVAHD